MRWSYAPLTAGSRLTASGRRLRCWPAQSLAPWRAGWRRVLLALLGLAAAGGWCLSRQAAAQETFTVSSATLKPGHPVPLRQVYDRNACGGANQSPAVTWHGAPAGTRSFAITLFDPDAPGAGWWHWAVAAIPPQVDHLPADASAAGALAKLGAIEARNDFGDIGYSGPCPPPGPPHHYVLTVYALNTIDLPLVAGRPAAIFEHELSVDALATAKLVVTYGR
jgi:Raf kinase inhibitor-like YbhB/YbcL family protein